MLIRKLRPLTTDCKRLLSSKIQILEAKNVALYPFPVVTNSTNNIDKRQTIVILGSGWGGYNLLRHIDAKYYRCVVVSPRPYFIFTPLLASTAVGTLETRVAIESVRDKGMGWRKLADVLNRQQKDTLSSMEFVQGVASDIDVNHKTVTIQPRLDSVPWDAQFQIHYDKLAIAVGCYSQTFKIPGVKEHAFFLKDISDALKIRNRILEKFEAANLFLVSEEDKRKLLHFCIVGGGPTGVEFSAELHDLIVQDLCFHYPALMPYIRITLFDVAKGILGGFDKSLSEYAEKRFQRQNISIRTSVRVEEVTKDAIRLKNDKGVEEVIPYGALIWSTGLAPNPFVANCSHLVKDNRQGLVTDEYLNVYRKGSDGGQVVDLDIFGIGDCAQIEEGLLPATAQVASQKALYLAKDLNQRASERSKGKKYESKPFEFNNRGIMAYLGGWRAIMQGSNNEVKGRTAWLLWRGAYFSMSVSIKNKILIPVYWFANWLFGRDISRF
ncbi:hypothetical protein V1514DRAFT_338343 [Lipomyces japonicus]|uniref:uncharacterized protein n=1 Tax=Lipomyces japonicus TaxID=56871 RepID=UPI0034CF84C5